MSSAQALTLHATCVAVAGRGVLVLGASGSGKSALALQLIGMGADLVADDRTIIQVDRGRVVASAATAIAGRIEARGVGILTLPHLTSVEIDLVVDLGEIETDRLPQCHSVRLLDISLPCLHKVDAPHFPAAVHATLRSTNREL